MMAVEFWGNGVLIFGSKILHFRWGLRDLTPSTCVIDSCITLSLSFFNGHCWLLRSQAVAIWSMFYFLWCLGIWDISISILSLSSKVVFLNLLSDWVGVLPLARSLVLGIWFWWGLVIQIFFLEIGGFLCKCKLSVAVWGVKQSLAAVTKSYLLQLWFIFFSSTAQYFSVILLASSAEFMGA